MNFTKIQFNTVLLWVFFSSEICLKVLLLVVAGRHMTWSSGCARGPWLASAPCCCTNRRKKAGKGLEADCIHAPLKRDSSLGRRGWIFQYLPSFVWVWAFCHHQSFPRECIRNSFTVLLMLFKSILPCWRSKNVRSQTNDPRVAVSFSFLDAIASPCS